MPSLVKTVVVPYLAERPEIGAIANAVGWNEIVAVDAEKRSFSTASPSIIRCSSCFVGTTGVPKCIVHCHGGCCCSTSGTPVAQRRASLATACSISPPAAG